MNQTRKRENVIGLFVLLIIALILNIALINRFLLTLFIGWLIAEIMMPLQLQLRKRWGIPAGYSALLVTLIATLGIILPLSVMTYYTTQKAVEVVETQLSQGISTNTLSDTLWNFSIIQHFFIDRETFGDWATTQGESIVKRIPALLTTLLAGLPVAALQLTLALLTCFFVIRDGTIFARWISGKVPLEPETKTHLAKSLTDTAVSSAVATFWAALAQASTLLFGFWVLHLPWPLLAFGISFFLAWLPVVGVTPVWFLATVYLLATGSTGKALIMILFGILSGLIDNIVRPWVLKGRSDLHPIISLIVIFGNLEVFGIFGVLTGPVLVKLLIECTEIWAKRPDPR